MGRQTTVAWLLVLGSALWLSRLVVRRHPAHGTIAILAGVLFAGVFVARSLSH